MDDIPISVPGALADYDRIRYQRQMQLWGWDEAGQTRLKGACAFIAGAGGLGSPVALYLAAGGVGELHICDADRVELSNLNRQILHHDGRLGRLKADSARETLAALNPALRIVASAEYLDADSVSRLVGRPDIIVDCLDNYGTRYLLNRYALQHHIPFVHAAIWGMMGQLTFVHPPATPCLRCIVPEPPPRELFPAVGAAAGVIGCLQALEVLKYLSRVGSTMQGRLLFFDGEEMEFNRVRVTRKPNCPDCGFLPPLSS
jgi:adenylyltransferase/sulfurtransferase